MSASRRSSHPAGKSMGCWDLETKEGRSEHGLGYLQPAFPPFLPLPLLMPCNQVLVSPLRLHLPCLSHFLPGCSSRPTVSSLLSSCTFSLESSVSSSLMLSCSQLSSSSYSSFNHTCHHPSQGARSGHSRVTAAHPNRMQAGAVETVRSEPGLTQAVILPLIVAGG